MTNRMPNSYLMDITSNSPQNEWNRPKEHQEECITVDLNMPTTTHSQADLQRNGKNIGHLIKFLTIRPTPAPLDVRQATLGEVSMVVSFALVVLDTLTVVGNDIDILVELIVTELPGPQWMLSSKCSTPAMITSPCWTSHGHRIR